MNTQLGCPVCGYISKSIDEVRLHLEKCGNEEKHKQFDLEHRLRE